MPLLTPKLVKPLAVMLAVLTMTATAALAQQDQSNPAPLNANRQVQNAWSSDRPTNFYYTFVAGPGEVTITLNAQTSSPSGETVSVVLLNQAGQPLTSRAVVIASRRGEQESKRFNIRTRQSVVMQVSVENNSNRSSSGQFNLRLEGAVEIPNGQPSAVEQSYPMTCRGGGALSISNDGRNGVQIRFQPGPGAFAGGLAPGQCTWSDRALRQSEPTTICDSSASVVQYVRQLVQADQYATVQVYNDRRGCMQVTRVGR
jgi:hypothetical protein